PACATPPRRGARPAPHGALRPASAQGCFHLIDQRFVLQHFIDAAQGGVPELLAVRQNHLEDVTLRVLATNHRSSSDREPPGAPTGAAGSVPPAPAAPLAILARRPPLRAWSRPRLEARSSRWWRPPALENSRRGEGRACAPGGSGNRAGHRCGKSPTGCRTGRAGPVGGGGVIR